ncbi:MAG: AAA family ATPase, partial [Nostoc sp.]
RLPELLSWLGLQVDLTQFWQHLGLSLLVLIIPVAFTFAAYKMMQLFYWLANNIEAAKSKIQNYNKPRSFVELAYGYLPLVLGGNLAHYLRLGLGEGGRILPVAFATFGLSGEQLPILVAHPAVTAFLQGTTIIFSVLLTILLTQKIAKQPVRSLLWQHLAAIALGV